MAAPNKWQQIITTLHGQRFGYNYLKQLVSEGNIVAQHTTDAAGNITGLVGANGEPLTDLSTSLQQVATRCILSIAANSGLKQAMTRSTHWTRDRVARLKIAIPNFYMLSGVETGAGAATSVTASIEYPAGTFTQVLFSGLATGSIADNGYLLSDFVTVAIPQNTKFFVRIWRSNSVAITYTGSTYPTITGDGFVSSGTTTPDLTMSGSVTQATSNLFTPCAIVAYTGKKAVAIMGDSKPAGNGETSGTSTDGYGDAGYAARAIGPVAAYLNLASQSDDLNHFVTAGNRVNRTALAAYASDMVWDYGTNDLSGGRTSGQIAADYATSLALFTTQRHWINTLCPRTASTDSWVTTGNQTAAATEAARLVVNTNIRALGIAGQTGCFDVADAIESSHNSGLFSIDTAGAAPARTGDGIHPNGLGHRKAALGVDRSVLIGHY